MSGFTKEIMADLAVMLDGYKEVNLEEKMEMLCRVTQYFLEKGHENLWVSLCMGADEEILNVTTMHGNEADLERETLEDADRIGADTVIVANDAWLIDTRLADPSCDDISVQPARCEGVMVEAEDGVRHLRGGKFMQRIGGKLAFGNLFILPV